MTRRCCLETVVMRDSGFGSYVKAGSGARLGMAPAGSLAVGVDADTDGAPLRPGQRLRDHDVARGRLHRANGWAGKPRSKSSTTSRRKSSRSRNTARSGSRLVSAASFHPATTAW